LASELDLLRELFESQYAAFKDQSERAKKLISIGESKPETMDHQDVPSPSSISKADSENRRRLNLERLAFKIFGKSTSKATLQWAPTNVVNR